MSNVRMAYVTINAVNTKYCKMNVFTCYTQFYLNYT